MSEKSMPRVRRDKPAPQWDSKRWARILLKARGDPEWEADVQWLGSQLGRLRQENAVLREDIQDAMFALSKDVDLDERPGQM